MVSYIYILECKNKLYLIKSKTVIDNNFIFFFYLKKRNKKNRRFKSLRRGIVLRMSSGNLKNLDATFKVKEGWCNSVSSNCIERYDDHIKRGSDKMSMIDH